MKNTKSKKNVRKTVRKNRGRKNTNSSKALVSAVTGVSIIKRINSVYKFKRGLMNALSITNPSATSDRTGLVTFSLAQLSGYTDFTALFNQYKIPKLKITFRMTDTPTDGDPYPCLFVWKNNNDALIAGNINASYCDQVNNVHRIQFSSDHREISVNINPYILGSVYSGGYQHLPASKQWLDINSSGITHYGYAYLIPSFVGGVSTYCTITADLEAEVSFKNEA